STMSASQSASNASLCPLTHDSSRIHGWNSHSASAAGARSGGTARDSSQPVATCAAAHSSLNRNTPSHGTGPATSAHAACASALIGPYGITNSGHSASASTGSSTPSAAGGVTYGLPP